MMESWQSGQYALQECGRDQPALPPRYILPGHRLNPLRQHIGVARTSLLVTCSWMMRNSA